MVVAAVWGEEYIQFLAALAVLPKTIKKNTVGRIHPFLSNHPILQNRPVQNS